MRKSKAEPSKPRNTAMTESFDAGKLAEELRALVSEAEALLRASGSADGAEMQPRAEAAVRDLRERLSAFEEQLSARARDIDGYVRGNPWQAVAVAGGVALLLGLLMGRRWWTRPDRLRRLRAPPRGCAQRPAGCPAREWTRCGPASSSPPSSSS